MKQLHCTYKPREKLTLSKKKTLGLCSLDAGCHFGRHSGHAILVYNWEYNRTLRKKITKGGKLPI